ncbi:MAG: hypothetical protein ACXVB9_06135 [Bdellovibrionota bacterium]
MRNLIRAVLILSLSVPNAFASEQGDAYRAKIRAWVMSHAKQRLVTIEPMDNDLASDFADELKFTNLGQMESANLLAARLENGPWSGSYWPVYAGEIANRYGDSNYDASMNWKDNARYLESALGKGTNRELSPAEKYDLLIGDTGFTLTKKMIRAGAPYAERDGSVPSWFGICHGWAPASFMEARPQHSVKTKAADGREIEFNPSDIKALLTLLWANGAGETRFIGGRCNRPTSPRDANNRETDSDCFDTNPATWHLSVVNQLGVSKRGFVADVSPAAEVWNQPAVGYRYGYLNPITGAAAGTLEAAKVKLADWSADPFSRTRSPKAVSVVKINMSFEYGSETQAQVSTEDRPEMDAHATQHYLYDLELDEKDEIVGGEWYSVNHPDFLWVPVKGSKASSTGDAALDRQGDHSVWTREAVIPRSWKAAAKVSSANEQPLARVVEALLDFSGQGR